MYRFLFRLRWLGFHLLVVVAVVAMVNLGFWQLRRLDERRDFNATVEARRDAPTVPIGELLADPDTEPEAVEWRTATATGTYLPDQVVIFNRSQNGRAGDHVLTPLQTVDGPIVLVNRGFVLLGTEPPAPPSAEVDVLGVVRADPGGTTGGAGDDGPVTGLRSVDIDRIAAQLDGDVAPVYLDLVDSDPPPSAGDPDPVRAPELGSGPHLSYAIQWFVFSIAVVVGWVLAVRRSVALRRDPAVSDGGPGSAAEGSPPPTATASSNSTSGTGGSSSG